MRRLRLISLLALLLLTLLLAAPAGAWDGGWTDADVSLSLTQASQRTGVSRGLLRCLSWHESEWNTYAVGRQGELGLFQLLPRRGLLPDFYAAGFGDPFNPYESALFAARTIRAGGGRYWSTWRLC